jgi:threonine dehydrogenase-like Zn-dependent dehydrogenase
MKALFFENNRPRLTEIPTPVPGPGEALIRVRMAGICNTDIEIAQGYMNFTGVPGHEFVGEVESAPEASLVGSRVVGEINAGCGVCSSCRAGLERHCGQRTVLGILGRDGAFAEYLTLPARNLVPVPDDLPDEKAVFAEPLAAALEILEQISVAPADRVLVIGDGKLGLLVAMVLRLTGCDLTLAGKHEEKMVLVQSLGVSITRLDSFSAAQDRFDVVVEASGHPSGWSAAGERVKPRGTLILKSTYHGSMDFNPAPLVINEITVLGSRCGVFPPALRLMQSGLVDPTTLVSYVMPFDQAEDAFRISQQTGVLKVLLRM